MAPSIPPTSSSSHSSSLPSSLSSSKESPPSPSPSSSWDVRGSSACLRTENPIRKITDKIVLDPKQTKSLISLSQGDPTAYGHLKAPEVAVRAVEEAVRSWNWNGYQHSFGALDARRAISEHFSPEFGRTLDPVSEVLITVGCNQAVQIAFSALTEPGDNILLPCPGYPCYKNFCDFTAVEARFYNLLPENDWEIDLGQLEKLRDEKTKALVVCNPGNPTGGVYSRKHLEEILRVAERLCLPIIADEVYCGFAFGGRESVRMGSLGGPVPIISVDSLSKRFLVPGWRLGWMALTDREGILAKGKVIEAIHRQMAFCPAASALIMGATRKVLEDTPKEYLGEVVGELERAALTCFERVGGVEGVSCPSNPQGSMFLMLKVDVNAFDEEITDDESFCALLLKEEAVMIIPGCAFRFPGYVRLMYALPQKLLHEAWDRMETFCKRHYVKTT